MDSVYQELSTSIYVPRFEVRTTHTPRDCGLETYNNENYLFFINDQQEYVLRYGGGLETYEERSLEAGFCLETFLWVESDRRMGLEVTATDTPFNKYVIP